VLPCLPQKKACRSAPDALADLAASTRHIGDLLRSFLGPSVEPSPERHKQASVMLKNDDKLTQKEKVSLHLLFSKSTAAADSYRNAEDWIRDDVAELHCSLMLPQLFERYGVPFLSICYTLFNYSFNRVAPCECHRRFPYHCHRIQ